MYANVERARESERERERARERESLSYGDEHGDGSRVPKGLSPADLFFVKRERERRAREKEKSERKSRRGKTVICYGDEYWDQGCSPVDLYYAYVQMYTQNVIYTHTYM